jgi:putative transposase
MARQPRIEYPGAFYHILARGNRREDIFHSDEDHGLFLETMKEACEKTGWKIHAWVLMNNHFHWLLETPEANLSACKGVSQAFLTKWDSFLLSKNGPSAPY